MDRQRDTSFMRQLSRAIVISAIAAGLNSIPAYAQNDTPATAGPAPGSGLGQGAMPPFGGIGPGRGPGAGRGMVRNMPSFSEFDRNGDGSISEQEFDQARANRIKERSQQGYPHAQPRQRAHLQGDGPERGRQDHRPRIQHRAVPAPRADAAAADPLIGRAGWILMSSAADHSPDIGSLVNRLSAQPRRRSHVGARRSIGSCR